MRAHGELVPGGISGDLLASAKESFPSANEFESERIAYYSDLAERFQEGGITKEEELELISYIERSNVHANL